MPPIDKSEDCYFDGLNDTHLPTSSVPTPPYIPRKSKRVGPKLLVCHDYKGGFYETDDSREYVFQYWNMVDIFVYFSHHRITIPPPSWIVAAHRHGVQILGTLILEWEEAREDLYRLVMGPNAVLPNPEESFDDPFENKQPSDHYIDLLVSIAESRGFSGWLVNIELPAGVTRKRPNSSDQYLAYSYSHASLISHWLKLLQQRLREKIGNHSLVVWYDSVTKDGKLEWQNGINTKNLTFYENSDAIFLNYHWNDLSLNITKPFVTEKDVFVGIDCFGRGVFGGGGFNSSQAIEKLRSIDSRLSIAFFAPGWTSESEILKHNISGSDVEWFSFFVDDHLLWNGWLTDKAADQLSSLELFAEALYQSEKKKNEEAYVRSLATFALRGNHLQHPMPTFVPIEDHRERDINTFRPLRTHFSMRNIPPTTDVVFYSNFSLGSGRNFFVEGINVKTHTLGWTDPTMCFPIPDILFQDTLDPEQRVDFKLELSTSLGWFGSGGLGVSHSSTKPVNIPLFTMGTPILTGEEWRISLIYHASAANQPGIYLVFDANGEMKVEGSAFHNFPGKFTSFIFKELSPEWNRLDVTLKREEDEGEQTMGYTLQTLGIVLNCETVVLGQVSVIKNVSPIVQLVYNGGRFKGTLTAPSLHRDKTDNIVSVNSLGNLDE